MRTPARNRARTGRSRDESGEGNGPAQQKPVTVDVEGLTERVVQLPVAEFRYSSLRGVQDGLVWLKEPLYGALGESGADIDAASPRPALERFDLKRRTCEELVDELDWFEVSGDGTRIVVCDHGDLRVIPSQQQGRLRGLRCRSIRRPVPAAGHGRPRRAMAPCLRRGRPDHAARLLGSGHGGSGLGCHLEPHTARCSMGLADPTTSPIFSGRFSASSAPHMLTFTPRRSLHRRSRWAAWRRSGTRRRGPLAGGEGAARRVLRSAGAFPARHAGRDDPAWRRDHRGRRAAG